MLVYMTVEGDSAIRKDSRKHSMLNRIVRACNKEHDCYDMEAHVGNYSETPLMVQLVHIKFHPSFVCLSSNLDCCLIT